MLKKIFPVTAAILSLVLITFIAAVAGLTDRLSAYLSKSERADADLLLVEGWLPDNAILNAVEEFRTGNYKKIVTTGIYSSDPFFNVYSNGTLIFRTKKWFEGNDISGTHSIEIEARSELGGEGRAHFSIEINGITAGDFLAETSREFFRVNWSGRLDQIDSIAVRFDNDRLDSEGDVNLDVKAVRIDRKIIIPWLHNTVYDMITSDGHFRIENNISSCAGNARRRLIMAGIDSSIVIAVPAQKVTFNRTLSSAIAFRSWLDTSGIQLKGINIISEGPHSRRTWMTYSKLLDSRCQVGIIPEPYTAPQHSRARMVLKTFREAAGLFYYRIILLFYRA
jgi:hypothetical protein